MFRRWRVRHSYPKPVVELVVRLEPIHGAAALSRLLDIPMSVIYRWRARNRDGVALSGNTAVDVETVDAETLATLVARCEELGFGIAWHARAAAGRARPSIDVPQRKIDAPQRKSATHAFLSNSLHDTAAAAASHASLDNSLHMVAAAANAPLRICSDRAGGQAARPDPHKPDSHKPDPYKLDAAAASAPSCMPALSRASGRYVFDACKERPERGVRSRMEAVRQLIDTKYFLDVDCSTLAETAQMSLHHFIRVFHDMFGMSPHQYLTRARVEAAKRLLLASSEPIEAIAVGVGFRSGPSLNRAFKRIEGASASEYWQTLKKDSTGKKQRVLMPAVAGWSKANGRATQLSITPT
jgi:AraC-like DNA-binding protein